ncbi:hypothetical protein OHA98_15595 [Streptomyces sp. NBC_00654]|uniref:hypothetical protein n=1 Tax=Streptomyces sp. NBC_00654 TaxID=2975799 RepID=UPI00224F7858|nr:hypothetical protein [Streptomyces sp. NBC_00654]MCX4966234.1 hypothetical protein [Streptomyces sp. NBC_00654]
MRASRALAVTATAFAAVGLAAPLAAAGGAPGDAPRNITVNPSSVHQGATMQVTAQGCRNGGKVWSNAFPTTELSAGRTGYATAHIRHNATPGNYNLSVRCNNNNENNNDFNGNGGNGGNGGDGGNGGNGGNGAIATHQFTVLPGRGAQGGLGGSMGPSSVEMQIGGGLVAAAAVGGAVFITRRRRSSDAAV